MSNRRRTDDGGESLIELLVSIALLGIASIAILASITMGLKAAALSSGMSSNQNILRNWAEVLEATPYVDCATTKTYVAPVGMAVPPNVTLTMLEMQYWNSEKNDFVAECGTDEGLQRVTLAATAASGTPDKPTVDELRVVIRKPCRSGC